MQYRRSLIALILTATCVWCVAQPFENAALSAVQAAFKQRIRTLRSQPQGIALRRRLELAHAAREDAEKGLPGIQTLDRQIEKLRAQLKALQKERHAIMRAHAKELGAIESELIDAEKAITDYERNDPQLAQLHAQRKALWAELRDHPELD